MKKLVFLAVVGILTSCGSKSVDYINATIIDSLQKNDIKLGIPEPYDWLGMHDEPGQSFEKYSSINPVTITSNRNKIYLQPLGKFSATQRYIIRYTADYLQIFFNLDAIILPAINDSIVPTYSRRYAGQVKEQLLTKTILDYLQNNIPEEAVVIMAITAKDLYPNEKFNYVFGQARTTKRVGVSSIFRYSTPKQDSVNYRVCLERLIKTSSHEIGHMFSCQHCTYAVCVMNGSNSLFESDSRPNRLCSECLRKLQWNLKFDVIARLKKLKDYFGKHKLVENYKLTLHDMNTISNLAIR